MVCDVMSLRGRGADPKGDDKSFNKVTLAEYLSV